MTARDGAHVRETDTFTLRMERDPQLRSTIIAVVGLDRAPVWEDLLERAERVTRAAPVLRSRLIASPLGLAPPRWIVDDGFDVTWHVRRITCPAPHTLDAVLAWASPEMTTAFDPARPLWEGTLVDGMEGGTAALVLKIHHSLADGIGGLQFLAYFVDLEREPHALGPMPSDPTPSPHGSVERWLDAIGFGLGRWAQVGASLATALPAGVSQVVRQPVQTATDIGATAASVARFLRPIVTTLSPVMTERGLGRRLDRMDVPFEQLAAAGHRADCSSNDAFLAAVSGGLRRYHEHHGAPVDELRVTMPISIRREGDPEGGNRLTLVRFELPVGIVEPVARMRAISAASRRIQAEPSLGHTETMAAVLNLLPQGVTAAMLKHVDVLATNVPGFPDPVYVAGARVESFYPFSPTAGSAANVALMSYRGTCNIGINTDSSAVPDPDVFRQCVADGFDEVLRV